MQSQSSASMESSELPPPDYSTVVLNNPPLYTADITSSSSLSSSSSSSSSVSSSASPSTVKITSAKYLPSSSTKDETFPYHPSLADFSILPGEWSIFTNSLHGAIAPTLTQKSLAVLSGIGAVCVISEPFSSTLFARYVLRRQVIGAVKRGLETKVPDQDGKESLAMILERWNARWKSQGVQIALEVFEHGVAKEDVNSHETTSRAGANDSATAKKATKAPRRWNRRYLRLVVTKVDEQDRVPVPVSMPVPVLAPAAEADYRLTTRDMEKNLAILGVHPVYRNEN